ncbi:MAG: polysaccharide biosynthesis/export family protein [Nitrospirae bacterium]|nr:polysaccharide biosynthesis/export family protein [Nitrospirota bacterium]
MGKYKIYLIKIRFVLSVLLFAALILPGCGVRTESIKRGEEVSLEMTTFSFDQKNHPYEKLPDYKISPGDVLDVLYQIRTWEKKDQFEMGIDYNISVKFVHVPEMNVDEKVRPDGTISLPYIGKYMIAGKTIDAVTKELKSRYDSILQNSDLFIMVPDYRTAIKELKADLHTAPRGLSRLVTVRPDGYVTFPMLGDILAGGRTVPEVSKELDSKYPKVLPDLHVDLFLEKHSGARFYVLGQVQRSGVYEIPKPLTVEQALSMAGSFTPGAQLDNIIVVRKQKDKMIATRVNLMDTSFGVNHSSADEGHAKRSEQEYTKLCHNEACGKASADTKGVNTSKTGSEYSHRFFFLMPDDIVYVPKRPLWRAAEIMREISDVLLFKGWNIGLTWELHNEPQTKDSRVFKD